MEKMTKEELNQFKNDVANCEFGKDYEELTTIEQDWVDEETEFYEFD